MEWFRGLFQSKKLMQQKYKPETFIKLLNEQKNITDLYNNEIKEYSTYQEEFINKLFADPHILFSVIKQIYNEYDCTFPSIHSDNFAEIINIAYPPRYVLKNNIINENYNQLIIAAIKNPQPYNQSVVAEYVNEFNERQSRFKEIYYKYIEINNKVQNARKEIIDCICNK